MNVKNEIRKNTWFQIVAGVCFWFLIQGGRKKTPVLTVGGYEPVGPDYVSEYFSDVEYFGENVIPVDYYSNWLIIAKDLDKIRRSFGSAILIKKGFTINEPKFNSCSAVEIYPQNNNIGHLVDVVKFMELDLVFSVIVQKSNKNIYLEL